MVKKQTAGRDNLGTFAPRFAQLNDDVLFGEVWSREEELAPHTRRDHSRRNCRSNHSSGFLCWLAQSLVCF